jgi:hypothetical protein
VSETPFPYLGLHIILALSNDLTETVALDQTER